MGEERKVANIGIYILDIPLAGVLIFHFSLLKHITENL
jgi:hypothetical protein